MDEETKTPEGEVPEGEESTADEPKEEGNGDAEGVANPADDEESATE